MMMTTMMMMPNAGKEKEQRAREKRAQKKKREANALGEKTRCSGPTKAAAGLRGQPWKSSLGRVCPLRKPTREWYLAPSMALHDVAFCDSQSHLTQAKVRRGMVGTRLVQRPNFWAGLGIPCIFPIGPPVSLVNRAGFGRLVTFGGVFFFSLVPPTPRPKSRRRFPPKVLGWIAADA